MSIFQDLGIADAKGRGREEFLYNLAACYSLLEKEISRCLTPYGLSTVKLNVLLIVKHIGGRAGLPQAEIAKRMIVSAGNITRLLDRLQKEELVDRVADPVDRRVNRVRVTKKASDLLDKVWPVYEDCIRKTVCFSKEEIGRVVSDLESLRHSILDLGKQRRIR